MTSLKTCHASGFSMREEKNFLSSFSPKNGALGLWKLAEEAEEFVLFSSRRREAWQCRGLDNCKYCGAIFLIILYNKQTDLNMISAVNWACVLSKSRSGRQACGSQHRERFGRSPQR